MAGAQLETFLRRLRRALGPHGAEGASDAQLLSRYVQHGDEEAFELLVWRHGLMVLNVCRRVLRHEHDAEDAFQATFLVLARKAGAIGRRESVSSWLYKVAYRIALRAKSSVRLRSLREKPLPDTSSREPINELQNRELSLIIDEEIQRLPEKYRVPLVLCHLEGRTIESAARSLNCPPGTVGTWLARARTLLRRRLADRGFDVSDVAGARNIVAMLSAALAHSTVRAAMLGTAEQAATAGMISSSVADLTKGALQTISWTRCTTTTVMILALSLVCGGGALIVHHVLAAEPEKTFSPAASQPAPTDVCEPTAVMLRWKFQKGKAFYQIFTTDISQLMKVMNNEVTQKQKQTFYLRWTPEKMVDGQRILSQKILGVKMDMDDIGPGPIRYDSTAANNPASPMKDFLEALIGAEFQFRLDAMTLEVLGIDGREKLAKKLRNANLGIAPLIDKILSEEALKEMADPSFGLLMGPARPGDSWIKRRLIDMGPIGKSQNTLRCTYEGKEDQLDKIAVRITMKYLYPTKQEGIGGLPFHIRKSNLRGNGTGFLYFDRAKGRLANSTLSATLAGTMNVEIGGQETQVELVQTQQTTIRTLDANPLAAALLPREDEPLRKENERLRKDNEQMRRRLQAVEEALHRQDKSK